MTGPGKVVVLGASGYIGSTLVARLASNGTQVRAVGRRQPPRLPSVASIRADATDRRVLARLIDRADVVVHLLANLRPGRAWRVGAGDPAGHATNVQPVLTLIEVLRKQSSCPLVLLAGTTSQVGCPPHIRIDGSEPDHPVTAYDEQKLAVERALLAATDRGILRGVALRLPTVYGLAAGTCSPGNGVVAAMVRRALQGQDVTMWHDGSVQRDLLHVNDVAGAFAAAIEHERHSDALTGRAWLLGTGQGVPVGDLFTTIAHLAATATGRAPVKVRSVAPPAHATPIDLHGVEVDSSPFRHITGWRPRTTLDAGLRHLVKAGLDSRVWPDGGSLDTCSNRAEEPSNSAQGLA